MSDVPVLVGEVFAAAAAGVAVGLAVPGAPGLSRGRPLEGAAAAPGREGPQGADSDEPADLFDRFRLPLTVLAGIAPFLFLGGAVGAVAGVVAMVLVHRALHAREPAGVRKRREAVERSLPHVVDLLSVALAAGAAPSRALASVASAVEGPVVEDLLAIERGLALGRDPVRVWKEAGRRPGLAALGRTMAGAVESGAPVSGALGRLAQDLAAASRLDAEARARAVGVRATAPLGACLLPAFVLVGIVPLVAGIAGTLLDR